MSLLSQSNIYLVIIPRNYPNDVHICGRCKVQYTLLSLFLKHKETCKENELKEPIQDFLLKKTETENLAEINSLDSIQEALEKDSSSINLFNNLLIKDENQLRPCSKVDGFEDHDQDLYITSKEGLLNNSTLIRQKNNLVIDCKQTLQNVEEDIATLLANQLSNEVSAGDLNTDINVGIQNAEPIDGENFKSKENGEKDENKVMYRGKMRKLFKCQVEGCTYKTLLRKDIERHSRVHTGERPFKCFLCEKTFNRTDKLLLHQRIHAGDKRYKCTKCDYASVDSGSLIKHLRVHNGERPFKCQLCSYRARDSSQLTVHLRKHTGDSPFICTNSKCKAAFKTNSDLKRHMVVHSDEKPHSCIYCPYKSTLKRNLQIHIQSQHPNGELKEFKCQVCPRFILPTPRKLKNHMRKYHGVPEEKSRKGKVGEFRAEDDSDLVEKQETYKKRKRKTRRNSDKIVVGVMNKAYECKLCDASFVCLDSLLTHKRYHNKVEEEMRKTDFNERTANLKPVFKKVEEDGENKCKFSNSEVGLNDNCVVHSSFSDSLRNAEILASLNTTECGESLRQYIMISSEPIQNVHKTEEFVLVQN